jgi:hypothetical protein
MDENNQREATALSSLQQLRKRISTGMDQVFESQRIITKMSLSFRSSRDFMLVDFGKLNFENWNYCTFYIVEMPLIANNWLKTGSVQLSPCMALQRIVILVA